MKRLMCILAIFGLLSVATQSIAVDALLHGPETAKVEVRVRGVAIGVGHFSPADDDMRDVHGNGIKLGGDIIAYMGKKHDLCFGASFFSAHDSFDGGIAAAENNVRIIPVTATWIFRFSDEKGGLRSYAGVGVGIYFWRCQTTGHIFGKGLEMSDGGRCLGYRFVGGIEFGGSTSFFLDIEYSNAEDKNDFGAVYYLGGTTLSAGLRFTRDSGKK